MIFAGSIFAGRKNKVTGKRQKNISGNDEQGRQYAQLTDLSRQRLLGYAESFRDLAEKFREEYAAEQLTEDRDRQMVLDERKSRENRQLIGNNLREVASIMEQVASKELCYEPLEQGKQRLLVHVLRSEGIYAENLCYLHNENAGSTIGMILYTEKKGGVSSEEVADMLSVLLKCRLEAAVTSPYLVEREKKSFLFVEAVHLVAVTGLSKVVKEAETISGDNFAILQSETGKKTIMLSDGTGSGKQACIDSGRVLDLMEKMLDSGFEIEAAVNMVNTAMYARGEENNHPTLDLCSIDLYGGECEICKVGGAVTFLKRGRNVDIISQGTLPLGIFQNINVTIIRRRLREGDYVVLMTDGVLDALQDDCEETMAETIRNITARNPQDIAETLLQLVLKSCGGHIRDDMTILVVGMWEN